MSDKAQVFLAPHLRHAAVTRAVTHERAKTGSWAPAPFSKPAPKRDEFYAERSTKIAMTLAEGVMAVSAFLQASDHALVSAARYESMGEQEKADRMYARAMALESLAERTAKAARAG
jgi:hypothetical protein